MELDDAYANGAYIAGADDYPPRWDASAEDFRNSLHERAQLDIPYGPGDRNKFDLFLPEGTPKGVFIFVHGGYWLRFDKSTWSHLAVGPLAHGWAVAMPSYDLCPDVSIADITRQVDSAVVHIAEEVDGPIALAGHSAGGHLVARMLDRALLPEDVGARLKTVIPISPLSDLLPLLRTSMNKQFKMDAEAAKAESPVEMQDRYDVPVTVWVGAEERPAFLDQAQWLTDAWATDHVIAFGKHHFNVIDPLADPDSDLVALIVN
ncbi:alpha/beta hydrolase [Phaeobacter gallaeciensis]|uniref:alpha/beta hydrolase n=1 Tax=Phaeobacter gallaeciensis TaxID=60890 RepID=UPI00237F7918|nr:alpha/beta hydrolase [Phaeobacter gallaeciensis]MDE4192224.1 alpha/beta hydrolase [Phaeobacter gallaeciensis]MDE4200831.1 alpha/beta hydrolase [Phaeobacter gallaeciensis]MDE4204840.1 alpha/beta hydrolase [Phaeobacter gallaeciensis]MDE4208979.1 alpha/beta hydrolase [Phaeobacter gallaeciensis]MDE4217347.1 alpha/beta hydrolase [Phaeobacter gallaeciensis]